VCRSAVSFRWLPPFGLGSVTRFDPAPWGVSPSQQPASSGPAHASSWRLAPDGVEGDYGAGAWERGAGGIPTAALRRDTTPLAAAMHPRAHPPLDRRVKRPPGRAGVGHAHVVERPPPLAGPGLPAVGPRALVALLTPPPVDGHPGAPPPRPRGLARQAHQPSAAAPPIMGAAEAVPRGRMESRLERTPRGACAGR
jgi:hypothetical protein